MPSSFLSYAVDWDGDGKRDIWATKPDVFASTAYYLKKAGWNDQLTWGRRVFCLIISPCTARRHDAGG